MIDFKRRFFCFGAAATLIVPPPRTFYFLPQLTFDLPNLRGRTLTLDDMIRVTQLLNAQDVPEPRMIVISNPELLHLIFTADGN
jgi:hypothetical protein